LAGSDVRWHAQRPMSGSAILDADEAFETTFAGFLTEEAAA